MRHCSLVIEDGRVEVCEDHCPDHGTSFEGVKSFINCFILFLKYMCICMYVCIYVYVCIDICDGLGVCNIPLCSFRTPLANGLCRVRDDDECFSLAVVGTTNEICVVECPEGTEEEHTSEGFATGMKEKE
jgi:hypothetical protein